MIFLDNYQVVIGTDISDPRWHSTNPHVVDVLPQPNGRAVLHLKSCGIATIFVNNDDKEEHRLELRVLKQGLRYGIADFSKQERLWIKKLEITPSSSDSETARSHRGV